MKIVKDKKDFTVRYVAYLVPSLESKKELENFLIAFKNYCLFLGEKPPFNYVELWVDKGALPLTEREEELAIQFIKLMEK